MGTSESCDDDYLYRCVMSVMVKVMPDSGLDDCVSVMGQFGQEVQIASALTSGAKRLQGQFNENHWDEVVRAFSRLRGSPPSRQISNCCSAMASLLVDSDERKSRS